jgi:uncharacterized protein
MPPGLYLDRSLTRSFNEASRHFPILMVTGARQVGKTTFLRRLAGETRTYLTLDDPLLRRLAKEDPALFMQRFPPPVLIDEIQYAPELLPHLKMAVDGRDEANLFWLTGSQQFHLMRDVSETLAGRVGIFDLLGLSQREATRRGQTSLPFLPSVDQLQTRSDDAIEMTSPQVFHRIWRGSFPGMARDPETPVDVFFRSYVQTYLQIDVRDLTQVGDELSFLRFLRASAARTGQLLNYSDLARDADVAPNTARRWLSILEASGMIFLLEPYHVNSTKRLVKRPKLYFLDTGLAAWLTEWSSSSTLEAGAASGPMFETWVVAEILKSWKHDGRRAPLYFFRDQDRVEVDLLIIQDGVIHPVEIKQSASPNASSFRAFGRLSRLGLPLGEGGVVCMATSLLPLSPNVWSIPVGLL